jgi:hypothetical protein
MSPTIRVVSALPGVLLTSIGIRWLLQPSAAAESVGMPLLDGLARNTQIGDLGSFFLCSGAMFLLGALRQERHWFHCGAMLMGVTAICRTWAFLFHNTPFPAEAVIPEIAMAGIALYAASRIPEAGPAESA